MAVYTTVDDTTLHAFLAGYDVGDVLSFAGIFQQFVQKAALLHHLHLNYLH